MSDINFTYDTPKYSGDKETHTIEAFDMIDSDHMTCNPFKFVDRLLTMYYGNQHDNVKVDIVTTDQTRDFFLRLPRLYRGREGHWDPITLRNAIIAHVNRFCYPLHAAVTIDINYDDHYDRYGVIIKIHFYSYLP